MGSETYLAIVHCEIQMMQGVMCGPVDDFLESMSCDHVRVMNLENNYEASILRAQGERERETYKNTPEVDCNKQAQV